MFITGIHFNGRCIFKLLFFSIVMLVVGGVDLSLDMGMLFWEDPLVASSNKKQ